jgi:hypothetical protein
VRVPLLAAVLCVLWAAAASATADGPDVFRVVGVDADERLSVRAEPDRGARVLGYLAHDADGVANLGCRGGLSAARWAEASAADRAAARKTRWCRIAHGALVGWAAGWHLGEGTPPAPVAFACDGLDADLAVTFLPGETPSARLDLGGEHLTLRRTRSASGARYADGTGRTVFWTKGREAHLERPGFGLVWCAVRDGEGGGVGR